MALRLSVTDLKRAGFNNEAIFAFVEEKRPILKSAGFSDYEINKHYGIVDTSQTLGNNQTGDSINVNSHVTSSLLSNPTEDKNLNKNELQVGKGEGYNPENNVSNMGLLNINKDKTQTNAEVEAGTPKESNNIFDHNLESYEKRKQDIQDLEEKDLQTRLSEGRVFRDELTDDQLDKFVKNGGNLEIDGKKIEVLDRVVTTDAEGQKIKTPILNTFETTGTFTKLAFVALQQSIGLKDMDVLNINEGLSFLAAYESNNANIRSKDDTKGGLWQIPDVEVPQILNTMANLFLAVDKNWQPPDWYKLAYKHKDATKLPIDVQRSMALIKLTSDVNAQNLLMQAAGGDEKSWIDLINNYYNADGKTIPEASERLSNYFSIFNTTNYKYVNGAKAFFADKDDDTWAGWITRKLMETEKGKTFVRNMGGQGYVNFFGSGGGDLSIDGLNKIWSTQINEEGYDPVEAYINVYQLQNQNFALDIVEELRRFVTGGDWKYGAGGALEGAMVGGAVTYATGGSGAVILPAFVVGGGYAAIETIREKYVDMILNGEANTPDEFWDTMISGQTARTYLKNQTVGTASAYTGQYLYRKGYKTAAIPAEVGAYLGLQSLLSGTMPTKEEFAQVSAMVFGFASATKGYNKMLHLYKKHNITPSHFYKLSQDPDFREDLLDLDKLDFDALDDLNRDLINITENTTNTKIVDNPKHEIGTVIETSESGSTIGVIIDRQESDTGQVLYKVDSDGEIIYVPEMDANVPLRDADTDVSIDLDNLDNSVTVSPAIYKDFTKRQENKEFNSDINEITNLELKTLEEKLKIQETQLSMVKATVRKEGEGAVEAGEQFRLERDIEESKAKIKEQKSKQISFNENHMVSEFNKHGKNSIKEGVVSPTITGSNYMFVNNKIYPNLSRVIKENTKSPVKRKNKQELLNKDFPNINRTLSKRVDEVFYIKKNGDSRMDVDSVVLRGGDEYFSLPYNIYYYLNNKAEIGSNYKPIVEFANNTAIFKNPLDNTIIAAVKTNKLQGNIKYQASTYYDNFKSNKDKFYTNKMYSNNSRTYAKSWDKSIPDEPVRPDNISEIPNMPQLNAHANMLYNSAKGLNTFDLIELSKAILKNPIMLRSKTGRAYGYFRRISEEASQDAKKEGMEVVIKREIQSNPKLFTSVIAHEIGHAIDYVGPEYTMNRGNILGRLATMKKFLNEFIDENGDPSSGLSKKELSFIKREAQEQAKKELKRAEKILSDKYGITPEIIKNVYTDPKVRELIDPDIYDILVSLDNATRVVVAKDALNNIINPFIDKLIASIKGEKIETEVDIDYVNRAKTIFANKVRQELEARGLTRQTDVRKELIRLSERWHPYDKERAAIEDPTYQPYRESSKELMAEFMMSFLLRPQWTIAHAPKATALFMKYFEKKPEAHEAYLAIQNDISTRASTEGSTLIANKIANHFLRADKILAKKTNEVWQPNTSDAWKINYLNTEAWLYRRSYLIDKKHQTIDNVTGKIIKKRTYNQDFYEAIDAITAYRYRNSVLEYYSNEMVNKVLKPLEEGSYNKYSLSAMLLIRNLATSTQRSGVANPYGLWADIEKIIKLPKDVENGIEGGSIILKKSIDDYINEGKTPYDLYTDLRKEQPELDRAVEAFTQVRRDLINKILIESNAFDTATLKEMLNNPNYVAYTPIDKAINNLESSNGIRFGSVAFNRKTIGTISDIVNVFDATLEKDMILITALMYNKAKIRTVDALRKNKTDLESVDEQMMKKKTGLDNWKDRIIVEVKKFDKLGNPVKLPAKDARGMKLISFQLNGKKKYYYINDYAAIPLERNPFVADMEIRFASKVMDIYRYIWTEINPMFWVSQLQQDTLRSYRNIPEIKLLGKNSYLKYLLKNMSRTYKTTQGLYDEVTSDMMKNAMLLTASDGYRGTKGATQLRRLFDDGVITQEQFDVEMYMRKMKPEDYKNVYKWSKKITQRASDLAWTFERLPKVAAYDYIRDMAQKGEIVYTQPEVNTLIRGRGGSGNFGTKPKYARFLNGMMTFYNATYRSMEGDWNSYKENPISFMKKSAYILLPKLVWQFAKLGVLGSAAYYAAQSISSYDDENFINIPLMKIGDPNDNMKPEAERLVYLRIPLDPTGRLMSGLLTMAFDETVGRNKNYNKTGIVGNIAEMVANDLVPQVNPLLRGLYDGTLLLMNVNPREKWGYRPAINEQIFEMGGPEKNKLILKYLWNNYGLGTLHRFETNNVEEIYTELEEILGFPIVGDFANRFIRVGDYPTAQDFRVVDTLVDEARNEVDRYAYDAKQKIMKGVAIEDLTKEEYFSLEQKAPRLLQDKQFLQFIVKEYGGNDLLLRILGQRDTEKRKHYWNLWINTYARDPQKAQNVQKFFDPEFYIPIDSEKTLDNLLEK